MLLSIDVGINYDVSGELIREGAHEACCEMHACRADEDEYGIADRSCSLYAHASERV